ncbi:MAG: thioredoxin fold domain-containing protein, partial [Methylophagaceae bacterium]
FASTKHSDAPSPSGLVFTKVNNLTQLNQQLSQSNQPAMLDFYADWCVDCKRMEATTFKDANVNAALSNTLLLQLDMTANTAEHKAVLKHFGIFGPPTILFFNAQGNEHHQQRLVGSVSTETFIKHLAILPQ